MGSESLHAPRERLSRATLTHHHALVSVQEELDAIDWYRQRADDCEDPELREILLHNMREEMEHACMALEWLRRNDPDWAAQMATYLFTEAPILQVEEQEMAGDGDDAGDGADGGEGPPQGGADSDTPEEGPARRPPSARGFTVGTMK